MYSEYSTEDLVGFVVEMGDEEKLDQIIDFKKSVDINNNIVNVKEVVFRSGKNRQNLVDFVNENYAEDYGIGGFLLGSAIGGYAGYKIGRARPQKRGFETEKKIGRKLKSGFKEIRATAKKHALGGEIDREEYATYTEAIRDYGKEKVEDEYNVKILSRTEAKRVMEKYEDAEVKTPEGEFLMDEPEQINDYPYFILGVGVWEDENKEILEDLNIPFTSYAKGGTMERGGIFELGDRVSVVIDNKRQLGVIHKTHTDRSDTYNTYEPYISYKIMLDNGTEFETLGKYITLNKTFKHFSKGGEISGEDFMLYARMCDVTEEGMSAGWVFGDGTFYTKYKKDAIKELRKDHPNKKHLSDSELMDYAVEELDELYYTEWEDLADFEYVEYKDKLYLIDELEDEIPPKDFAVFQDTYGEIFEYSKGGSTNTQVAQTIMQQLGGMNKVIAMTGAYNFATNGKNVSFRIKNKKINHIKITLNAKDLYDVEFGRLWGSKFTVVSEYNDVYFDQLIPLFEENTGMYLKLFDKGGEVIKAENKLREAKKSKISSEIDKASRELDEAYKKEGYAKGGSVDINKIKKHLIEYWEDLGFEKEEAINLVKNDIEDFPTYVTIKSLDKQKFSITRPTSAGVMEKTIYQFRNRGLKVISHKEWSVIDAKVKGSAKYGSWYYISDDIWHKPMGANDDLNVPPEFDINDDEWGIVDLDRAFTPKEKKEFHKEMQRLFGDWKGGLTNIYSKGGKVWVYTNDDGEKTEYDAEGIIEWANNTYYFDADDNREEYGLTEDEEIDQEMYKDDVYGALDKLSSYEYDIEEKETYAKGGDVQTEFDDWLDTNEYDYVSQTKWGKGGNEYEHSDLVAQFKSQHPQYKNEHIYAKGGKVPKLWDITFYSKGDKHTKGKSYIFRDVIEATSKTKAINLLKKKHKDFELVSSITEKENYAKGGNVPEDFKKELEIEDFIYYTDEDAEQVIMIRKSDGSVASDNYFAENDLYERMVEIANGREDYIYMRPESKQYLKEFVETGEIHKEPINNFKRGGKTESDYIEYLNEIGDAYGYDSEEWIIGGENRVDEYWGRFGNALQDHDPIAFNVGYNDWERGYKKGGKISNPTTIKDKSGTIFNFYINQ